MTVVPQALPSPLPNLILAQWLSEVSVEHEFLVDVSSALETDAEERLGLVDRPYRTLRVRLTGLEQDEATRVWMNVVRNSDVRFPLPLYQDQMLTTSSSTGQFVNVATSERRLFVGARVVVFDVVGGYPNQVEYVQIEAVNPTNIDLGTSGPDQLQNTYAAGSFVIPVVDVEVQLEGSKGIVLTDEGFEVDFQVAEVAGSSALPTLETGNPTGFPTKDGYPILTENPNWRATVASSVTRAGESFGLGRGFVVAATAERPKLGYEAELLATNRTGAWDILRFLESRRGRKEPFWLVAPQTLFRIVAITSTYVDVSVVGNIEDAQSFLDYVAIVEGDGTTTIRGIDSIALQGGAWRITFDTMIVSPPSLSDVVKVTSAHFVRLASDAFSETWITDEAGRFTFSCLDVLQEKAAALTDPSPAAFDLGPIIDIGTLYLWVSASGGAWRDEDTGDPPTPDLPTIPYPLVSSNSGPTRCDFVYDCRRPAGVSTAVEPYLERVGDSDTAPHLAYWKDYIRNGGQRTFYHFGIDEVIGWTLENSNAPFWAAGGLTVFLCGRFGGPTGGAKDHLVRQGIFEWFGSGTSGNVKFFATADSEVAAANIAYTEPTNSTLIIMAVRWDPGVSAELFIDGGAAEASAASPAASLDTDPRATKVMQYLSNSFGPGSGLPQEIDSNLDRQCFSNDMLIFADALSDADMDVVGQHLASLYGLTWTAVA